MRIVITGSSSGIGRALAERLIARGHAIWGLARSDQSDLVSGHPGKFQASRCDVGNWKQVAEIARQVAQSWSNVDGVITCAGLQGEIGRTLSVDPEKWSTTVRTNLDGTFHTLRAFGELLARAPRRAKIICLSGGGATKPRPNFSAYGTAKTGVVRLVETIAVEERGRPIDINAVAPGAINTRMTDEIIARGAAVVGDEEYQTALKQKQKGGASLERALDLVEWLLSPASDGISGRLLSAPWDHWPALERHAGDLADSDIYTLRRIVPEDRKKDFSP